MEEFIKTRFGQKENMSNIHVIYKAGLDKDTYGIEENKIVEINNFIDYESSLKIINDSEKSYNWESVGFHGAQVLLDIDEKIKNNLIYKISSYLKQIYGIEPKLETMYIQKWTAGAYGIVHNDRYNFDGSIGNITYRYAANTFLHSNFGGGEILFPDHSISIKPELGSAYMFSGGPENEHGISTISYGVRYTIVSFWDDANNDYSKEELDAVEKSRERWAKELGYDNRNGKI
jgi:hypothetical protein